MSFSGWFLIADFWDLNLKTKHVVLYGKCEGEVLCSMKT